ncbi:MAG: hypothetical protein J1F24_07390 [Oscillospiraceae bacterium]|nr:hypothetical protein [Oscillospiraceae bacterium]
MARKEKRGRAGKASYFVPAASGKYVYSGPLYSPDESNITAKKANVRRMLFSIGITALSAICGFLPVPGLGNTFFVLVPYALTLIFAAVSLWKAGRISHWGGENLREYVYNTTVVRLPLYLMLCVLFAVLSIVGEAVYLILNGINKAELPFVIIFFCISAAVSVLTLIWRKVETAIKWNKR